MTTTKEGGGRGEREREKEREREGEESRNTFLLESSKLMRKKRRERGWRCQWCCECAPPSFLEERGSERQNETGLGCSRSRKSPRKMNLWISLVLVRAGWKEFVSKRRAKKNKEKRRKFLTQTKQTKKKEPTKKKRPKRETDQTLSFLLLRNTHYYYYYY